MKGCKLLSALLRPPLWVLLLLLPPSAVLLIHSMRFRPENDPIRIGSYVLAFCVLTLWCLKVPALIQSLKTWKRENRHIRRWLDSPRLRMNVTLTANVLWNGAYAALQLGLGLSDGSPWYFSLAAYYGSLAMMRFFLVRHTRRHSPGERLRQELKHYRACGWVFLVMNLALSGMMLYRIREGRLVRHHEIITIAMAAYTFTTLTVAIVNVIRYRRYQSPALSASKAIALAAACVSLLSLEGTMLATFDQGGLTRQTQILFLALSGGAISVFIVVMAVYMIVRSSRMLNFMEEEHGTEGNL